MESIYLENVAPTSHEARRIAELVKQEWGNRDFDICMDVLREGNVHVVCARTNNTEKTVVGGVVVSHYTDDEDSDERWFLVFPSENEKQVVGSPYYIGYLLVDPAWRRKRIGRSLISFCQNRYNGTLYVHAEERNNVARNLYSSMGFEVKKIEPHAYPREGCEVGILYKWSDKKN